MALNQDLIQIKNKIITDKQLIATALTNKGVDSTSDETFESFSNKITNIKNKYNIISDETVSFFIDEKYEHILNNYSIDFLIKSQFNKSYKATETLTDYSSIKNNTTFSFIPLFDTSNVKLMDNMFSGCTELVTIPHINTINVTNMYGMFWFCENLITIPLLDTSNVTIMNSMFLGCMNLNTIPLLNTSNVNLMNSMFSNCKNLITIPLLDISNISDMNNMFGGCIKLTTCKLKGNKNDLDLSICPLLNKESILYIMNNAQTVRGKTLTINAIAWNNSGLTDNNPDVLTFKTKGWTLKH